jgi:putative photosynthetic complex assembly protein 2
VVTLSAHILPLLYVVMLWFASTALVVALDHRTRAQKTLTFAGVAACAAVAAISLLAPRTDAFAAYASFTAALVIWGWHELSFLTGAVTGPRRAPLPDSATGWTRFRLSSATVIHHEIAIAVTLIVLAIVSRGLPNQTSASAFAILFAMRLSTKFNIFLGVPNFSTDIMPPQLAYLKSYFRNARFNALMPLSLIAGAALTFWLGSTALATAGDAAINYTLLTGLALLGVIEHLFLVLPIGDTALWRWAVPNAKRI